MYAAAMASAAGTFVVANVGAAQFDGSAAAMRPFYGACDARGAGSADRAARGSRQAAARRRPAVQLASYCSCSGAAARRRARTYELVQPR